MGDWIACATDSPPAFEPNAYWNGRRCFQDGRRDLLCDGPSHQPSHDVSAHDAANTTPGFCKAVMRPSEALKKTCAPPPNRTHGFQALTPRSNGDDLLSCQTGPLRRHASHHARSVQNLLHPPLTVRRVPHKNLWWDGVTQTRRTPFRVLKCCSRLLIPGGHSCPFKSLACRRQFGQEPQPELASISS